MEADRSKEVREALFAKVRELHAAGCNLGEIAATTGHTKSWILRIHRKLGLQAIRTPQWAHREPAEVIEARVRRNGSIAWLYVNTDLSVDEITKRFECSAETVYRALSAAGAPRRQARARDPRRFSDWEWDEIRSRIRAMYRDGRTLAEITAAEGVPGWTVIRIVRRAGLPGRRPPPEEVTARRERARVALLNGASLTAAARAAGDVSGGHGKWVRRLAEDLGVPIRKKGQHYPQDFASGDRPRGGAPGTLPSQGCSGTASGLWRMLGR